MKSKKKSETLKEKNRKEKKRKEKKRKEKKKDLVEFQQGTVCYRILGDRFEHMCVSPTKMLSTWALNSYIADCNVEKVVDMWHRINSK